MSFAQEVKRVVKDKEVLPTNDASPEAESNEVSHAGTEVFNTGLEPSKEPVLADTTKDGKAPAVDPEAAPAAKIRIGGQDFNSMEDAIKYANDLELSVREQEAFNAGKESAKPKVEAAPEPEIEDLLEEELFVNPKEALKKYKQHILKEMQKETAKEKSAEQKARDAEATRQKTWNDFYSKNTDLAKNQEFVNFVLSKNPELLAMNAEKALEVLANKTREYISSVRDTQLPTQELQSKPVIAPKGGSPSTATKPQTTEKAIDFISQLRKLNKNKAVQPE